MTEFRTKKDFLGEVQVPDSAYWDKRTQRFFENYPISGMVYPEIFIRMVAHVKKAAAQANESTGLMDQSIANAIAEAADNIIEGKLQDQFIVDPYAPNTAFNMNANEVIANRSNEILGGVKGDNSPVHPNDHVNMGQSTVDVLPTVMNLVFIFESLKLLESSESLMKALADKGSEFNDVVKVGRTHLMDGHPIKLGQEFYKYSNWIRKDRERISQAIERLKKVRIGTNIGTAVNLNPVYRKNVIRKLSENLNLNLSGFEETVNSDDTSDYLELSSSIRSLAVDLKRIANDIRFMNSGPFAGIAEIEIPATEPGSSFFPGKVNPGVPESVMRAALQAIGIDSTVSLICQNGEMDANILISVIALDMHHSLSILSNACDVFARKTISGIKANRDRIKEMTQRSIGFAVVLSAYVGYDRATELAREIKEKGKNIREVLMEAGIEDEQKRKEILSVFGMDKL